MKSTYTTFYFVRHGKTTSNAANLIEGHNDSPLTAEGEKGVRELAEELKDMNFDMVIASDLGRAIKTAEILMDGREMTITTSPLLRERNFGIFENLTRTEYGEINRESIARAALMPYEDRKHFKFHESIESRAEMIERLVGFLKETAERLPEKKILLATHGGIFHTVLVHLGDHTDYQIANAGILVLETDGEEMRIASMKGITPREPKMPV